MANIRIKPQSFALMPQISSTTSPFRILAVGKKGLHEFAWVKLISLLCAKSETMDKKGKPSTGLRLKATANDNLDREYRFSIEFFIFQDSGLYIAYCPSLDISTSGKTFNEAVGNFYEMFQLHIECCVESGTLHDDLLAHGWKMRKRDIVPPAFSVLMKKPEMKKLMTGNIGFEKVVVPARIPAFA